MSSKTYGNEPAFPVAPTGEAFTETEGKTAATHMHATAQHYGCSKRELFAGLAMMGLLSRESAMPRDASTRAHDEFCAVAARYAVKHANALCDELAKDGAQ